MKQINKTSKVLSASLNFRPNQNAEKFNMVIQSLGPENDQQQDELNAFF